MPDGEIHPASSFAVELPSCRRPERLSLTLDDGCSVGVYYHRATRGPVGLPVLYVHGIQSHPGWFVASSSALAEAGHDVFQVTRRGSGDSPVDRGHASSARQLLADLAAACRFVLVRTGAGRLHLVGVSWGGKLVTAYAGLPASQSSVASVTLVAPGVAPRVDVPALTKLKIAVSLVTCPRRRFAIPLNDVELFTDNPVMRAYLGRDPFRLHDATARFLYVSRRLDMLLRRCRLGAGVRTTLILASRDRIIDNSATASAVARITAGRARVVELDGAHSLEFEADPTPLHRAIVEAVADPVGG